MFLIGLVAATFLGSVVAQADSDNDGILDEKESQLASMYCPYLHFASGESFFPTEVNYHIENSELYLKSDDTSTLVDSSPTTTSISLYSSEDYFLNNTLGSFEGIAQDYEQEKDNLRYTVYARVTQSAEYYIVQFWFFYAFNTGINQHQGDWEMVSIVLDSAETPLYAAYSQHFSGERAAWEDVEKTDDTHPRVYVALGSHANYFRSYQGKLGVEGDIVGSAQVLEPTDLQVVLLGEKGIGNHPASQDWLEFGGRWGNWARQVDVVLGAVGPRTPGHGENAEKWDDPTVWAGDMFVVSQSWFTMSWITYYFLYIFAVVIAIIAVFKVWRIVRRRRQGKLNLIRIMRSKGSLGLVLGIAGIALYFVALVLPWYLVMGDIQTTVLETAGTTELVRIDGINGILVNTMQDDQGLARLFGLGIPFSIILSTSVLLNILDIVGVEKSRGLAKKFIMSGISSLIPVILILVFISQLTGLVMPFAESMAGGEAIPPQIEEIARRMSSSPITGEYSGVIETYGSLYVTWGLALGSYLFIAAAIVKIVAGVLTRQISTPSESEAPSTKEAEKDQNDAS